MTDELHFATIAEAADLIRARKLSPVELTQAHLKRIAELDPQLNAYVTVTADPALEQARRAEQEIAKGNYRGPLHGIPFGLKDIYNTRGILTTAGSRVCSGNVPDEDATTVRKLYAAGAVLLGKLATHEFAHGGPRSTCRGRRRATHGTSSISQAARVRAQARRSPRGSLPSRSAPTPAARSAARHRTAASWD